MKTLQVFLVAITLLIPAGILCSQALGQEVGKDCESGGFSETVTDLVANMQGKWSIKSATLMGAELPLSQFELLTVDENGFSLAIQKRTTRFAFKEFRLESKTFLAKCSSPDYPEGLAYEISVSDGVIKIRLRANGAQDAPEPTDEDRQLLVHTWTKSNSK